MHRKKPTEMVWSREENGEGERLREMLEWRPEGRRPAGRPRKRWMEAVEEAIQRRNKTLNFFKARVCAQLRNLS